MVEEEDELASSRSSSYGGKTPRAPKMRHPSRTNHSIDNNNSSNNHDWTRQDSIESYMNDDFEDDDEDYSVDFDNQSHSSNRVSPRAVKMQQQHHYPQDQYTKSSSSRTHGSSSSASSTRHSSRKSKTMGTQANGTKDVGCQAMMVPLPPLGYDPMLYFGAPAMMGGGMGGMMGGGMMGGMSGMMGGGMMPPSMIRMPPPGSFYGRHPAMGPMHAWGSNNASSPGSSVAPSRSSGTTGTTGTATGTTESSTGTAATDAANNAPTGTRNSSDMFAQQMEMSRLTFEKQLETIREHIHKTHARVAATAQAAGYQNYTTLASTQEYIRKMRKPQPLSFSEAMQTVDTKYAKEL